MAPDVSTGFLSDAQIESLLLEAEERLANKDKTTQGAKSLSASTRPHSPVVAVAATDTTATSVTGPIAIAAPAHKMQTDEMTIRNPQRKLSKLELRARAKSDAGPGWFNMPKTDLTPELRRDLQILRMRDVLDPKQFYKKDKSRALIPEHSQVGTMVEGPSDWFNRASKKEKKRTLLQEVLESEKSTKQLTNKYGALQTASKIDKKGRYKKQKKHGKK